ncbi:uncharacterized protein LOC131948000 [Physella acuta]|uniref:uncharacterized protein LOC131948000 n=1 Tax=Physella acuta TaxID=109671 RepID=UPI0027DD849C|nr:uncharacterized protein LOC131948000 [Physella acuta]
MNSEFMKMKDFSSNSYSPSRSKLDASWFKLAVAVAIIRNKPAKESARKHTEKLQALYMLSQTKLHEEILKARLHTNEKISTLSSYNNQTRGLTAAKGHNEYNEATLIESISFMQSICSLQKLASQPTLENHLISDSAKHCIQSMSDMIGRGMMTVSQTNLCEAASSISSIIEKFHWLQEQDDFMCWVCRLVEQIICQLLQASRDDTVSTHRHKSSLVKMLLIFMECSCLPLLLSILESLVEYVELFCEQLQHSQRSNEPVDPSLFENSYFIISALEQTAKLWRDRCCVPQYFLHEAQTRLDRALAKISSYFPLVAHSLMKVTSLLEAILQNR